MFGVNQQRLFLGLSAVTDVLCDYTGEARADPAAQPHARCDCKYGFRGKRECEQNGCPEVMEAAAIINALTPREFAMACKRAHVIVSSPMAPPAKKRRRPRITTTSPAGTETGGKRDGK